MRKAMIRLYRSKTLILMVLPAIALVFLFQYVPMGGIVLAFKQYRVADGFWGSKWVGLSNFRFFFMSGQAAKITLNTVLYNMAFILVNNALQVVFAVVLSEMRGRQLKRLCQSMMLLPYFMSWVVVASIAYNLFNFENGFVNSVLCAFGANPVNIYATPGVWKYILVFFNAWKSVGYGTVVYLASIAAIDQELNNVAAIDGANIFQRVRYVTLPSIMPTVSIVMLLAVARVFRGDFGLFYQLIGNNGMLFDATDIIDTYVFRSLLQASEVGMSAAVGFYQSVLCFVTIMAVNAVIKWIEPDYALF